MKIAPEIFNGNNKIILSETMVVDISKQVSIKIPRSNDNNNQVNSFIHVNLFFEENKDEASSTVKFDKENINIYLYNFSSYTANSGTLKPMDFNVGNLSFYLLFSCVKIVHPIYGITVTIYEGES